MSLTPLFSFLFFFLFPLSLATQFPLPFGVQPEGVTFARGSNYFAADIRSGSIFLVDVTSGLVTTAVAPIPGRIGVGIDASRDRLFVAGGGSFVPGVEPALYVYDIATGKPIAACSTGGGSFVNDVIADKDFAFYTDSFRGVVYKLSIRALPRCRFETIPLPTPAFKPEAGVFRANGIVKYKGGLIVANSELATPFFIDILNGNKAQRILPSGTTEGIDGLDIVRMKGGSLLYVTQNSLNRVSVWKLAIRGRRVSAKFVNNVTSSGFNVPTTVAVKRNTLVVANAAFDSVPPTGPLDDDVRLNITAIHI